MRHRTMSALSPTFAFQTNSEQYTLLVACAPVVLGQQAPIRALLQQPRPVRNDDGDGAVPWKCFQLGPGTHRVRGPDEALPRTVEGYVCVAAAGFAALFSAPPCLISLALWAFWLTVNPGGILRVGAQQLAFHICGTN